MFFKRHGWTLFEKDGGGDPGAGTATNGENDGNPAGDDPKAENPKEEKLFTQAELDAKIEARLQRERAKQQADAEKAKAEAESKALADQEKFKELSEKQAQQLAALTAERDAITATRDAAQEALGKYEKALKKILDTQMTGIPDHVKPLLAKLPLDEQFEWLADNQEKLKVNGVPPTPRPDGQGLTEEQRKQAETESARLYRNKF